MLIISQYNWSKNNWGRIISKIKTKTKEEKGNNYAPVTELLLLLSLDLTPSSSGHIILGHWSLPLFP